MTSLLSIPSMWALAFVLAKIGIFAGVIAGAGGVLALGGYHNGSRAAHTRLLSYSLLGAFIGFHSSLAPVLIQAGQINDAGVMGMFDSDLVLLLRGTPVWESAAFRGAGFALSALLILSLLRTLRAQRKPPDSVFYRLAFIGQALALGLVAYGFSLSGHVSVLDAWVRAALAFHVAAMAIWVGMLLPLRWCCGDVESGGLGESDEAIWPPRHRSSRRARLQRCIYAAQSNRHNRVVHNGVRSPNAFQTRRFRRPARYRSPQ